MNDLKEIVKGFTQSPEERAVAKALRQFAKGQLDKAIATLSEARSRSPEDAGILFESARLLTFADRSLEGADALRSILRRDPAALPRVVEMIEETRARHPRVGFLHDAVAEHHLRRRDLEAAAKVMERMGPEEVRTVAARHTARWEKALKSAPAVRPGKLAVMSACHLALCHEVLREYSRSASILTDLAGTNPEELPTLLPRLRTLATKDYQNLDLKLVAGDLLLRAGHAEEAENLFNQALETSSQAAAPVAEKITSYLKEDENPSLRWLLASASMIAGDADGALRALDPLVEAGVHLDDAIGALVKLAGQEASAGPARRLLADAYLRRGHGELALETLLQVADDEGLTSIHAQLQALVTAHPKVVRAHHLLADIHLAEGDAEGAVASLMTVRELAPGEVTLLLQKATRALEIAPSSVATHLLVSDLLCAKGELARTVVVLRHLICEAPGSAEAALTRLTGILEKDDPCAARARIGAAEACLGLRRHPEALAHIEAIAAANPEIDAEYLHQLSLLSIAAPEHSGALVDLLHRLEPRAAHPRAVKFVRGEALFHGGDPIAAAGVFKELLQEIPERNEELRRALERFDRDDPRSAEARYLLAMLHLERSDYAAAEEELSRDGAVNQTLLGPVLDKFEAILAATPDDGPGQSAYLRALGIGRRFERIIDLGQQILPSVDSRYAPGICLTLGDALRETRDCDGAVRRYYEAHRRDPSVAADVTARLRAVIAAEGTHPLGSLVLGKVLSQEGVIGEAVESLRAASAADPALVKSVLHELGELSLNHPADPRPGLATIPLLLEIKDIPSALEAIAGHLDAHPNDAPILGRYLESILAAEGDFGRAHYELGRATQVQLLHGRASDCYLSAARADESLVPLALKRLQEIIESDAECAEASAACSTIFTERGKPLQAADALWQAVRRNPETAVRLLPRLEEIWRDNRDDGHVALHFASACRQAGQHARALPALADASRDASLLDAVQEELDAAVTARPDLSEAWMTRGRIAAQRMRVDPALDDLAQACSIDPRLLPDVIGALLELRRLFPDSRRCALLLADHYLLDGMEEKARELLLEERDRASHREEKLSILFRLAHLAATRGEAEEVREHLLEASHLASDRNEFLSRSHEVQLALLRLRAARSRGRLEQGPAATEDVEEAVLAFVDLGEVSQARALLEEHGGHLEDRTRSHLQAAITLREGDFARASDQMRGLGPSRTLAFGAERSGNYALAAETLECLARHDPDPEIRNSLRRIYREMVATELMGGSRRLEAETTLNFDEREAA